jgi:alpha-tubulin suppressor-like RCC1 family protein
MTPNSMPRSIRWLYRRRRTPGQMIVLLAFFFVAFLAMIGSAVDYGFLLREEQQIKNAIDAAALAGARGMIFAPTPGVVSAQATAATYLNLYGYQQGVNSTTISYRFTTPTAGPTPRPLDSMEIQVDRVKPTYFWRIVGINQVLLSQSAKARPGQGQLFDVIISVDETNSMDSADVAQLRAAVAKAINDLNPDLANPRSPKIALAQFQGQVCPSDDGVLAWGDNDASQLGTAASDNSLTPVIAQPSGAAKISAGGGHSMALRSSGSGRIRVWGENSHGQVDANTGTDPFSPVTYDLTGTETAISAGGKHSMALAGSPSVLYTWGDNTRGQLGRAGASNPPASVNLGGTAPAAISAGGEHSLVLLASGSNFSRVRSFGDDTYGQLGNGAPNDGSFSSTPVTPSSGASLTIEGVAAGAHHSLAWRTGSGTNRIYSWGRNNRGQLGRGTVGTNENAPAVVTLPASGDVQQVAAGGEHTLALYTNGNVYSWGANGAGQLGRNGTTDDMNPAQVTFPGLTAGSTIIEIAAGANHSLARDSDGQVWSWGANGDGQLGDGTTTTNGTPTVILSIGNATTIAAGGPLVTTHGHAASGSHSLAVACTGFQLDAHVLIELTADKAKLLKIADNSTAVACPPLPAQQAGAVPALANTDYGCPLKAVGGSGTYIRGGFAIAQDITLTPDWDLFAAAKGGRPEAKRFLIVMTDGQNNAGISSALADLRTTQAAARIKPGINQTQETPCLQTTTPPCDDIVVYTIGFFDLGESNWDGPPRLCGPDKAASGGAVVSSLPAPSSVDTMLLNASSSTPGLCDKYIPLAKSDSLPKVFEVIVSDILRGQLVN